MNEILDKLKKQDGYFDDIYERLGNIYDEMPTKTDVNRDNLEENVLSLKMKVKNLEEKLDHLIYLIENLEFDNSNN